MTPNKYESAIKTFREELLTINHPIVNVESFDRYVESGIDNIPKLLLESIKILYQNKLDTDTMRNVMVEVGYGKFWDNTTPLEVYRIEIEELVSQRVSGLTNIPCSITLDHKNFRNIMETLRMNELETAGAFMLSEVEGKKPTDIAKQLYNIIDSGNICCVEGSCGHEHKENECLTIVESDNVKAVAP